MMMDFGNVSPEALAFLKEIEQVCIKHKLGLSVSGYDSMEVWKLDPTLGGEALYCQGIYDHTASGHQSHD